MDWNQQSVAELSNTVRRRHAEMQRERNTDRRNFSVIWNKYLTIYGAVVLGVGRKDVKHDLPSSALFNNLLHLINYNNEMVADALIIDNPDRLGQYIVIKREMAEKILVLGMV
jgi:hypothetical protein